jgi:site-specific DNA-methyltransferase (adenine-specific)
MLFTPKTLGQLLWLREALDLENKTDRFIMATLLGILHANADKSGKPRGLTIAMPNTFSMSPGYVARYIRDHHLEPPNVDVLDVLERRLAVFELPNDGTFKPGVVWEQDATTDLRGPVNDEAKLVFTSPPYLHVILYGKFNWLRLWLLGHERKPVDQKLFTSSSLPAYLEFMKDVLQTTRAQVRDDGYACFVIGDVRKGEAEVNLAREVARHCVAASGFSTMGIITDKLPVEHKVSRIWGETRGRATRTDRILMLAGPRARDPGPVPDITW